MMAFKRREEKARIGSTLSEKPVAEFELYNGVPGNGNKDLRSEFESMQRDM